MGAKTGIEWTDSTYTPIRARVKRDAADIARAKGYTSLVSISEKMQGHVGPHCEHASPGCDNCYSEVNNHRCLPANNTGLPFDRRSRDLVDIFIDEAIFNQPLHWKRPRKIFACSQTDPFGEWVPDSFIGRIFGLMAAAHWHTFQVLTKHADRMCEWSKAVMHYPKGDRSQKPVPGWPPNVWLGISAEDQQRADERIPFLLQTKASIRFVSAEPLLGPIDISRYLKPPSSLPGRHVRLSPGQWIVDADNYHVMWRGLDWIVVGGESGSGARPMHPDWARFLRDQCQAAGIAFFMKQWGTWAPASQVAARKRKPITHAMTRQGVVAPFDRESMIAADKETTQWEGLRRMGKKEAGAMLDGREWKEFPV